MEALGKPPGWSHPKAMRDYIRRLEEIPQTERIAGAVDRELQKEVVRLNGASSANLNLASVLPEPITFIETKPMDTNRTGFGGFKSIFGEGLSDLKKIASDLDEEMRAVVAEGQKVAETGKQIMDAARREIAEARAALAQFSNGTPE